MRKSLITFSLLILSIMITTNLFSLIITRNHVHVREKPSFKSRSKNKLKKGTPVQILAVGKKEKIGKWGSHYWYKVRYTPSHDTFLKGWVYGAFVSSRIAKNRVKLRSKPSTKRGKILMNMKKGTKVLIIKVKTEKVESEYFPDWYYVRLSSGKKGWVFNIYVQ